MRKPRDEPLLKALAAEVKRRRLALEMSQEDLAFRADVHRTFVGKIEVGQTQPSFTVLFHLAQALETDVLDLLAGVVARVPKETRALHKT